MRPAIACLLLVAACDEWQTASKADLKRLEARLERLEANGRTSVEDGEGRARLMSGCLDDADDAYWNHVKLNGRKKPGTDVWTASAHIFEHASKLKEAAVQECRIRYGK